MASERVRELAREHPEAFGRIVGSKDHRLSDHLQQVLAEEQPSQERAAVSAD